MSDDPCVGYGVLEPNREVQDWIPCRISVSKKFYRLGREHSLTYVSMLGPGGIQTLTNEQVVGLRNELRGLLFKTADKEIVEFSAQLLILAERIASDPRLSLIVATRGD
jgi:hypothetical protein